MKFQRKNTVEYSLSRDDYTLFLWYVFRVTKNNVINQ